MINAAAYAAPQPQPASPSLQCVENLSAIFERWQQSDHIVLYAGEMTAQELRSIKAVVAAIQREVETYLGANAAPNRPEVDRE